MKELSFETLKLLEAGLKGAIASGNSQRQHNQLYSTLRIVLELKSSLVAAESDRYVIDV